MTVIDFRDVDAAAREMAGNHRTFAYFSWSERPVDDEDWTVAYTKSRDSRLLEETNADAIEKIMLPFVDGEPIVDLTQELPWEKEEKVTARQITRGIDVYADEGIWFYDNALFRIRGEAIERCEDFDRLESDAVGESHNHWACGWVDGYRIRVYRGEKREITNAFKAWCEIQERLSNYPLLDEEDYSRREYEATIENISQAGRRYLKDDAPEDWAERCFSWFWDNNQAAVENRDDQGGYPSDQQIMEAMTALDLNEPDAE